MFFFFISKFLLTNPQVLFSELEHLENIIYSCHSLLVYWPLDIHRIHKTHLVLAQDTIFIYNSINIMLSVEIYNWEMYNQIQKIHHFFQLILVVLLPKIQG